MDYSLFKIDHLLHKSRPVPFVFSSTVLLLKNFDLSMSNPGSESIYKVDHATFPDSRLDSAGNIDQSEGSESVRSIPAGFSSQCAP